MAKSFYTAQEAAERLGKAEPDLKDLVRAGALREFRDGANVTYKVDDVEALVTADSSASDTGSGSASGEVVLEPVEDSSIELTEPGRTGSGRHVLLNRRGKNRRRHQKKGRHRGAVRRRQRL